MAFFDARAPIFHRHHDHSRSAGGSTINDKIDAETAALIANLALDDLEDLMDSNSDFLPPDEAIAYLLQSEQIDEWLSRMTNAKLAKNSDSAALDAEATSSFLDAFIIAEEAAV